jgi:hypothetical protein
MDSSGDERPANDPAAISEPLGGPPFLRHYPSHRLVTWQPHGTLNDDMLDRIGEWLVAAETITLPFKRFVDLSRLTAVAVRTRHLFEFARKRVEELAVGEPVRSALFSDDWVSFGIANLYESIMVNTPIKVRAFRDLNAAAEWLRVPADVLTLKDVPSAEPGYLPRKKL